MKDRSDPRRRRLATKQRKANDSRVAQEIGERIRRIRSEKLKMTQHTLASELGVSHGTVSYWERGGNAQPANLRRFAQLAGISMELLTNGADAKAFSPRWNQLEQRLMHVPSRELDELFDMFDELLDFRDRLLGQSKNKGDDEGG